MSVALSICKLALTPLWNIARETVSHDFIPGTIEQIRLRLTNHHQLIRQALERANEQSWYALELVLAKDSFLTKCQILMASGDQKEFINQVKAFLQHSGFFGGKKLKSEFQEECLKQLRAAKKAGLLALPKDIAAGGFLSPPQKLDNEEAAIEVLAQALTERNHPHLAQLIRLEPQHGKPLLATAIKYFFQLEIQKHPTLGTIFTHAKWEQLQQEQKAAFSQLHVVLVKHGDQLELIWKKIEGTYTEVLDLKAEVGELKGQMKHLGLGIQQLLARHHMAHRELQPQDSQTIQSKAEKELANRLRHWYESWTPAQRALMPATVNALGKVLHGTGDYQVSVRIFSEVGRVVPDKKTSAEPWHNGYLSALEQRDYALAFKCFLVAVQRCPERFKPFPIEKYVPQRILGAGGFGVTFLCQHAHAGGSRAVKTFRTDLIGVDETEKIKAEAQALEKVNHPSVIQLFDCAYADAQQTKMYLVMEHFDGPTLAEYVRKEGPIRPKDFLELAKKIAEGLQAAHQVGILHRDIKPDNVLVRRNENSWEVKIIDFGLAVKMNVPQATIPTPAMQGEVTLPYDLAGTLDYASPEQLGRLKDPIGKHSDIYGFGKTCLFALFGTPQPIGRQWKDLSPSMQRWLDSCLEFVTNERFNSFEEVLEPLKKNKVHPGFDNHQRKKPKLVVARGREWGQVYVVKKGENVIGLDRADINLSNQEYPAAKSVLLRHCVVVQEGETLSLGALDDHALVYVNRDRLYSGLNIALNNNDIIQVGSVHLRVEWPDND